MRFRFPVSSQERGLGLSGARLVQTSPPYLLSSQERGNHCTYARAQALSLPFTGWRERYSSGQ